MIRQKKYPLWKKNCTSCEAKPLGVFQIPHILCVCHTNLLFIADLSFTHRFVHTVAATATKRTKTLNFFHCHRHRSVNTVTRFHDTHFFRCCCRHEWVLNLFMTATATTQKMPLPSQCSFFGGGI